MNNKSVSRCCCCCKGLIKPTVLSGISMDGPYYNPVSLGASPPSLPYIDPYELPVTFNSMFSSDIILTPRTDRIGGVYPGDGSFFLSGLSGPYYSGYICRLSTYALTPVSNAPIINIADLSYGSSNNTNPNLSYNFSYSMAPTVHMVIGKNFTIETFSGTYTPPELDRFYMLCIFDFEYALQGLLNTGGLTGYINQLGSYKRVYSTEIPIERGQCCLQLDISDATLVYQDDDITNFPAIGYEYVLGDDLPLLLSGELTGTIENRCGTT